MALQRVDPDDLDAVARSVDVLNAARLVDDPDAAADTPELSALWMRYGWDLEPETRFLYRAEPDGPVVGVIGLHTPEHENTHVADVELVVHPEHRRRGHGTAMMVELVELVRGIGRNTIWLHTASDDASSARFLRRHGFSYASHEARRYQFTDKIDWAELDRMAAQAAPTPPDYRLERTSVPSSEDLLVELVPVVGAINDAPMGDLAFEDVAFDVARIRDTEQAAQAKGEHLYQVIARRISDGEIGGHTVMIVQPRRPDEGVQYNTAVARDHRGHRLGLLLKIEMLRWLATAEPQVKRIETWNHADNAHMIDINERLGYRLSQVFDAYQRFLD